MFSRRFWFLFSAAILALVLLAWWVKPFYLFLIAEIMTLCLFAMSFDLVYGFTGMLSLGHAIFFGAGSYFFTLSILHWQTPLLLSFLLAIIGSAVMAWIVGFFAVRARGMNFVVVTIIFSLVIFYLSFHYKSITGGDDGLSVRVPDLFHIPVNDDAIANYYVVLAVVGLCFIFYRRLIASPMGKLFLAIKTNEERTRYIGFNTQWYRLTSFIISGAFSGLAGALYTMTTHYSNNKLLHWTTSIDVVVWTAVGGPGTLIGPVLGTGLFTLFREFISFQFKQYPIIIGIVLILFVIFVPQGLLGVVRGRIRREER